MKLFRTASSLVLQHGDQWFAFREDWDGLVSEGDLYSSLEQRSGAADRISAEEAGALLQGHLLAPIGSQEVWAAGVTYLRSRDARMEEAQAAGGGDFYDKVYVAERPELFFKSQAHRVAGPESPVYIRQDSTWNVPEPELTLFINAEGSIQGYTVGNDMSSRSIEGENPLYLPQAKVYERSAALGPCLYVPREPLPGGSLISMRILRGATVCFEDSVAIDRMKRRPQELAEYLCRGLHFPAGCFLMTGTCLVPDNSFTLQAHDRVEITIEHIGTLVNTVAEYPVG